MAILLHETSPCNLKANTERAPEKNLRTIKHSNDNSNNFASTDKDNVLNLQYSRYSASFLFF